MVFPRFFVLSLKIVLQVQLSKAAGATAFHQAEGIPSDGRMGGGEGGFQPRGPPAARQEGGGSALADPAGMFSKTKALSGRIMPIAEVEGDRGGLEGKHDPGRSLYQC